MRRRPFATVIVGPSALQREGLAMILCAANFRIVASQTTLDNLRVEALAKYEATLLIVDASDDPGIAARLIAQFKAIYPPGRIAVLGERSGPADILSAFRAGANAYFGRVSTCEALIKALELVMLGETILPAQLSPLLDRHGEAGGPLPTSHESGTTQDLVFPGGIGAQQLSERESCILRCIVDGASNKLIARKINIAEATVKVHVKAILRKIRVQNRTQAAIWALNNISTTSAADGLRDYDPSRGEAAGRGNGDFARHRGSHRRQIRTRHQHEYGD